MDNNTVQYWEFELTTTDSASLVTSNSSIVNIVCASFATISENHVVSKIQANHSLLIGVLTKGEEAMKVLLEDYATDKIFQELKILETIIAPCRFCKIQLIQTGFVLCNGDAEFANLKYEADSVLSSLTDQERKEVLFNQSLMNNDGEGILAQHLSPSEAEDLIRNLYSHPASNQASTSTARNLSLSMPSTSTRTVNQPDPPPPTRDPSTSTSNLNQLDSPSLSTCHGIVDDLSTEMETNVSAGPPNLILRDYQEELSEPGLEGKNCIIVAPTGSGKTFVAVNICKEHIKNTPNARVLFLVPRVPLVRQQHQVFTKYLGNIVYQVCGESSTVPASVSIRNHTLSVMTPQILLNLLNNGRNSDGMVLEEITLLVFDECHHAMKNAVYNKIMGVYLDEKLTAPPDCTARRLPQIVGLTASPGVGKAKTEKKAEENIQMLMANLDVTIAPVQVARCRESLKYHQTEANEDTIVVPRNPDDIFSGRIRAAMKEIESMMQNYRESFYNVVRGIVFKCSASYDSQEYEAYVVTLLKESKLIVDKEPSSWFMGFATHLREYNRALTMNDHVRSSDVRDYLENVFYNKVNPNEVDKALLLIFEKHNPLPVVDSNPMLEKLRLIVKVQYTAKPESRSIIFVKTRPIAKAIVEYLKDQPEIIKAKLNPLLITGANAKAESLGMNQNQQENNLKAFREGESKIIVATSVAEEGLDIEECNLVIGYSYSTNEIGRVQRKGRGRAKDSRYVVLALADSGHPERERLNQERVELTDIILKRIHDKDPRVLKSEILEIQIKEKKERDFQKKAEEISKRQIEDNTPYDILCVGCKAPVTTSRFFQHINNQHHVVVDPGFKHRALIRRYSTFEQIKPDEYLTGKIFCKNPECEEPWGTRMLYKKAAIYVLKIANFIISDGRDYRKVVTKWSKVPFKPAIKPLNLNDYLVEMLSQDIVTQKDLDISDNDLFTFVT